MIQAIFFDLYETLITEWEYNKKKTAYSVDELGLDSDNYKNEWAARRDKRMDGTYPDHQNVLRDILKAHNKEIDESIIAEIHQRRVNAKSVPFHAIENEIIVTLQTIKEMNIKIGLISNCAPEEVEAWSSSDLADLFDDVVFSYKVKLAKPNPEIYLAACKNLGVLPEESIFIGDGGSNELPGASSVGMKAYQATWFQPSEISQKIKGYAKLKNPSEIIDIL